MLVGWVGVGGLPKLPSSPSISEHIHRGAAHAHASVAVINLTQRNALRFSLCASSLCSLFFISLSNFPSISPLNYLLSVPFLYLPLTPLKMSVLSLWVKVCTKILCVGEWPCMWWVWESEKLCVCGWCACVHICQCKPVHLCLLFCGCISSYTH